MSTVKDETTLRELSSRGQLHKMNRGDFMLPHNANPLGKGAFATVYKGHHRTTKVPLAIKVIEFDSRPEQDKRYLTQELYKEMSSFVSNVFLG